MYPGVRVFNDILHEAARWSHGHGLRYGSPIIASLKLGIEALQLFHRLIPNKRFEPVFSTVIMAVCSLFNRMLLLTDLIPVYLLYCGQTVMIGCNHTSFEWTRAVRHIYGIIRHMQGLYMKHALDETTQNRVDRLWEYSKNLEEVPLCRSVGHKSECLCYVEEHLHERFGYPA